MTQLPAGYSGTPLAKKLGIKSGFRIVLINTPEHYLACLQIGFTICNNNKQVL